MTWRLAKSLETLRKQVNATYPTRSKVSDGTIGDPRHAAGASDHNPAADGVVKALDITNDPKSGCVSNDIAEALAASRDPRIKYLISNGRICSGPAGPSPWKWRKYTGSNKHNKHFHISVRAEKQWFDSTAPWSAIEPPVRAMSLLDEHDEQGCDGCGGAPEAAPADKTVVGARTAAAGVAAIPVAGQVASSMLGESSDIVDQITTVADKSGNVIAVTKQVVSVPKPGFWNALLAIVTSPGFLVGVIITMGLAWAFVWWWQRQRAAQ